MTYTEVKEQNQKRYYYRVRTLREGKKFKKNRIYLGKGLTKGILNLKEKEADAILNKKKMTETLDKIISIIRKILKKNKVKRAGIFGSYARNEQKKKSDIDILTEYPKGLGGFAFVGIAFELEKALKRKVDLVTYNSLHPLLKERILKEEIRII
jgi:hypothetical protein